MRITLRAMAGTAFGALLAVVWLAAPAAAQQQGAGVRAGVSVDPDQFFFGGHLDTPPLVDRLSFRPNAEIGIGDGLTTVALNVEFAYWIPLQKRPWSVYVGGGPAVNIYSQRGETPSRRGEDTSAEGGFNILVGVGHRDGLFTELKVGALDSPSLKFTVGYTFR